MNYLNLEEVARQLYNKSDLNNEDLSKFESMSISNKDNLTEKENMQIVEFIKLLRLEIIFRS